MVVGYKRVSTLIQSISRQLVGVDGINRVFEDKASEKNIDDRVQLNQLIEFVRDGDTVIVLQQYRTQFNQQAVAWDHWFDC